MEQEKDEIKSLLVELGLYYQDSIDSLLIRVHELNMRQLDRLKMMLLRAEWINAHFTEKTMQGIKNNDLASFSEAVEVLKSSLK